MRGACRRLTACVCVGWPAYYWDRLQHDPSMVLPSGITLLARELAVDELEFDFNSTSHSALTWTMRRCYQTMYEQRYFWLWPVDHTLSGASFVKIIFVVAKFCL